MFLKILADRTEHRPAKARHINGQAASKSKILLVDMAVQHSIGKVAVRVGKMLE